MPERSRGGGRVERDQKGDRPVRADRNARIRTLFPFTVRWSVTAPLSATAPELVKWPVPATPPFVTSWADNVSVDWTVILPLAGLGDEPLAELCDEPHEDPGTAATSATTTRTIRRPRIVPLFLVSEFRESSLSAR